MRNLNLVPVIHKCGAMVSWNWLDESTAGVSAGNTHEVSASSGNVAAGPVAIGTIILAALPYHVAQAVSH